jgi:hypothetical protein
MENKKEPHENWHLAKIEIEFQKFGSDAGKYTGRIRFENGDFESFSFKIRPDMAQPYIELISSDIVKGAESLGNRLIESLGLNKTE